MALDTVNNIIATGTCYIGGCGIRNYIWETIIRYFRFITL